MRGAFPSYFAYLIIALLGLPILFGLLIALLGSFGYFPILGARNFDLEIWRQLWAIAGLGQSITLSLATGFASTLLAFIFASGLIATGAGSRLASIIVATPHAAMATGIAFMIAPSGLITRLLGFDTPPQIASLQDPYGLGLVLGLTLKETPFLWLLMSAAAEQINQQQRILQARSFGYSQLTAWLKIALPLIYPHIRLPLYVVLVFGISVVDMAQILGPTQPPTLAVATMRKFYEPDIQALLPASAMAILILVLAIISIGIWRAAEVLISALAHGWLIGGARRSAFDFWLRATSFIAKASGVFVLVALVSLLIWSLAWRWSFPDLWPQSWSTALWGNWHSWLELLLSSLLIGSVATFIGLCLAVIVLEARPRFHPIIIYFPLILPQISFLFGLNIAFLQLNIGVGFGSVIWAHLFFVLPYFLITLSDPWRRLDQRYVEIAASLGCPPFQRLFKVKFQLLLRPVMLSVAVGFSVSIALYLPTVFLGAGRVETLTTEAVALTSSGDRRIIGLYGFLLMLLPLMGFWFARLFPALKFRERRGMKGQI